MGLIVVVNVSSDDYFYNAFNSIGFNVSALEFTNKQMNQILKIHQIQIFDALEYPDTPSGGCTEQFIAPGTEAFIRIIPDTLETESSVSSYSAEKVSN